MRSLGMVLLVLPLAFAKAQVVSQANLPVTIASGTQITVPFQWRNEGTLENNGTITISGAWLNDNSYSGSGEIHLNGISGSQTFSHNGAELGILRISGAKKRMFSDATIVNQLVLQDTTLEIVGNALLIINETATITGGSNNAFIDGPLYQQGLGTKFFPVGDETAYLPVTLEDVRGVNPIVGIEAFDENPNATGETAIEAVSNQRYWELSELTDDQFGGSKVILPVINENTVTDFGRVVVAESDDLAEPFTMLGRSASSGDAIAGSVTSSSFATKRFLLVAQSLSAADVQDSLALVQLYQETNGDSWADNTNWLSGFLIEWTGLTLNGEGRVVALDLSNNNLDGTLPGRLKNLSEVTAVNLSQNQLNGPLPTDWLALQNLQNLDLASNQITGLPDFSIITTLNNLNVENNNLRFEDLEPNIGIPTFNYVPQAQLQPDQELTVDAGTTAILPAGTDAPNNQYQWYKDDQLLTDESETELSIPDVGIEDFGAYRAEVTNSVVPGLTLQSGTTNLFAQADVRGQLFEPDGNLSTDAGAFILAQTSFGGYDTIQPKFEVSTGDMIFNNVRLGNYVLVCFAENGSEPDSTILPTYLGNVFSWENADTLFLRRDTTGVDINLVAVPDTADLEDGDGFITGIVQLEDGEPNGRTKVRRSLRGSSVRVSRGLASRRGNNEDFELVATVYSDDDGRYTFPDLPNGTYLVEVEVAGYPNTEANAIVEIGGENNTIGATINALVNEVSGQVEYSQDVITGTRKLVTATMELYPNPVKDKLFIRIKDILALQGSIKIFSREGVLIKEQPLQASNLKDWQYAVVDVSDLKDGLYALIIEGLSQNPVSSRIIVSR